MSTHTKQVAPSPSSSTRRQSTQKIVAQNGRPLEEEFSRMLIDSERDFQRKLDQSISSQRDQHYNALQEAIERHEYVRKGAETAKRVAEAEEELKRTTQEQEEIRKLRELERRTAEAAAKRAEEQRQAEAQRQALEQEARRRQEELERQAAERRARDEKERAGREAQKARDDAQRIAAQAEADRKAQEAAEAAKRTTTAPAVLAPTQAPVTAPPLPAASGAVQSPPIVPAVDAETEHKRYLQIHKELKDLRAQLKERTKDDPARGIKGDALLKKAMNELRRELTKSIGQLTMERGGNTTPTANVRVKLEAALKDRGPTVDIRKFIAYPPSDITDADAQKPAIFVYGLNAFVKAVMASLGEAADSVQRIDPIGILVAAVFSEPIFQVKGASLIDILLAKYHKSCGVLFGIYGPHDTAGGRTRLGWQKVSKEWITENYHNDRMTAFGAGFAAIALRDFSKAKRKNALPPRHFWRALARIINTPPKDAVPSHFLVLKSMIECGADRFVGFYGHAALVALRKAVIEFPSQAPKSSAANGALVLKDILAKNHGIIL